MSLATEDPLKNWESPYGRIEQMSRTIRMFDNTDSAGAEAIIDQISCCLQQGVPYIQLCIFPFRRIWKAPRLQCGPQRPRSSFASELKQVVKTDSGPCFARCTPMIHPRTRQDLVCLRMAATPSGHIKSCAAIPPTISILTFQIRKGSIGAITQEISSMSPARR